jgi:hypothetical protein
VDVTVAISIYNTDLNLAHGTGMVTFTFSAPPVEFTLSASTEQSKVGGSRLQAEWWPVRNLSRCASESVSVDDPSRNRCGSAKLSHFQISYMGRWLSANAQARKYTHGLGTNESPFHPDFQTNAPPTSVFANTAKSRCCCLTFASRVQVI